MLPGESYPENEKPGGEHPEDHVAGQSLLRLVKTIRFNPEIGKTVDSTYVDPHFYNSFNYSILSRDETAVNMTVGITSANPREGKTLVSANLAVSLAVANERDTVLVDLNFRNPTVHSIFGVPRSPGLLEGLNDRSIGVYRTQIKHLYVLPTGDIRSHAFAAEHMTSAFSGFWANGRGRSMNLGQLAAFRDVIYSLRGEFEFVVIDMPSVLEPQVPLLLTNQMDGLLIVVDARRTKQHEIESVFHSLNQKQIIGFVVNRIERKRGERRK